MRSVAPCRTIARPVDPYKPACQLLKSVDDAGRFVELVTVVVTPPTVIEQVTRDDVEVIETLYSVAVAGVTPVSVIVVDAPFDVTSFQVVSELVRYLNIIYEEPAVSVSFVVQPAAEVSPIL